MSSSILKLLEVGLVGVHPRLLFLDTTATLEQVIVAGFLNGVEGSSGIKIESTDLIICACDTPKTVVILSVSITEGIITAIPIAGGPGGGSFPYLNTFWLAQNGLDENSGESINSPKLTFASALAARTSPTTPTVINIVDDGTYEVDHTLVNGETLIIVAPSATITCPTSGKAPFTLVSGSILSVECGIYAGGGNTGNAVDGVSGTINCNISQMFGDIAGGGTVTGSIGGITGDITKDAGLFTLQVNNLIGAVTISGSTVGRLIANIASQPWTLAGTSNIFAFVSSTGAGFSVTNSGTGKVVGVFQSSTQETLVYGDNLNLTDQDILRMTVRLVEETTDILIVETQSNEMINYNDTTNAVCTIPSRAQNPNFPDGFRMWFTQQNSGNIHFVSDDTIESVNGRDWTEGRGAVVQLTLLEDTGSAYVWGLGGNIASSATTSGGAEIFVSQLTGSDTTGIGSVSQPYATFGAAVTAAGTPSNAVTIICIDGETYDETVTIANGLINISAPEATLVRTAGGNGVVVTSTGSQHNIDFGVIAVSGGGVGIVSSGTSAVSVSAGSITGGASTVDGALIIRAASLVGTLTESGSGSISYLAAIRSGTFTGTVSGLSPSGTTGKFKIGSNEFDTADAAAGYVWTTDGSGGSSLQAPAGGGDYPTSVAISPTAFSYFNAYLTGSILWVSSTAPNTQGAFAGSTSADYGTVTFKAKAGTYNICVLYTQGTGNGIGRFIVNGGTPQDIDMYGINVNQYQSYQWSVTLVDGDNTLQLTTNGKNGSSSDYLLSLGGDIILNRTGA